MLIIALQKGGSPCSKDCPFYSEEGVVRGINGPLKTHCRATMETVIVDCEVWNPHNIQRLEVSDEQWQKMQQSISRRAKKVRKPYPKDHAEIHHVGYSWRHDRHSPHYDQWNASKSSITNH